jgi:hypothetical protein
VLNSLLWLVHEASFSHIIVVADYVPWLKFFSEEVASAIIYSNVFFCVNQLCFQKFQFYYLSVWFNLHACKLS